MIKNTLIILYVFTVLFLAATAKAGVQVKSATFNPDLQQVIVEGIHDFQGALQVYPRAITMENGEVLIKMEPSCGRSCKSSEEKNFISVFDVRALGLIPGRDYSLFINQDHQTRFLGLLQDIQSSLQAKQAKIQGVLTQDETGVFLRTENENIYLAVIPQINIDQFLNKTVVVTGFQNIFNILEGSSDVNSEGLQQKFFVLSILELNIL